LRDQLHTFNRIEAQKTRFYPFDVNFLRASRLRVLSFKLGEFLPRLRPAPYSVSRAKSLRCNKIAIAEALSEILNQLVLISREPDIT
jgi:hypothetical protein